MPSKNYRLVDCPRDIVDNIARIEKYVDGLDHKSLEGDDLRHDAVERCLERICEAAFRLGDKAAVILPDQPWQDNRGMGNRLCHAYDQIDAQIVWNVVSERLPGLKADAIKALERLAIGH